MAHYKPVMTARLPSALAMSALSPRAPELLTMQQLPEARNRTLPTRLSSESWMQCWSEKRRVRKLEREWQLRNSEWVDHRVRIGSDENKVVILTDLQASLSPRMMPRMEEGRMISHETRVPIPSQGRSGYGPNEGRRDKESLAVLASRKVTSTSTWEKTWGCLLLFMNSPAQTS